MRVLILISNQLQFPIWSESLATDEYFCKYFGFGSSFTSLYLHSSNISTSDFIKIKKWKGLNGEGDELKKARGHRLLEQKYHIWCIFSCFYGRAFRTAHTFATKWLRITFSSRIFFDSGFGLANEFWLSWTQLVRSSLISANDLSIHRWVYKFKQCFWSFYSWYELHSCPKERYPQASPRAKEWMVDEC